MNSVQDNIQQEKDALVNEITRAMLDVQQFPSYDTVSYMMLLVHRAYPRIGVAEKYNISERLK